MRIGIDARLWSQTGVGRYIRNISQNLMDLDEKNEYVLFVIKKDFEEVKRVFNKKGWKVVVADSRWHSINEQLKLPKMIDKEKVDLVHFPYFSVPLFYKRPFVVTIHDLILHHYPTGEASTLPLWLYGFKMLFYRIIVNNAARKSKKTISVSNSTKDEIVDHLFANKGKVEVIYEAADDFKKVQAEKINVSNFFLYVGNVYPHKNTDVLIKAFEKLIEKEKDVKLVFALSEDYFSKRLKKQLKDLVKKERVIFIEDPTDGNLAYLYNKAIALVRPSLMEGFSLPPLEAMQRDGIAILSDIPVHKEIFEDAPIYFNPSDVNDLVRVMNSAMLLSDKERELRIKKGVEIANRYTWKDAAQRTLKVYESSVSL